MIIAIVLCVAAQAQNSGPYPEYGSLSRQLIVQQNVQYRQQEQDRINYRKWQEEYRRAQIYPTNVEILSSYERPIIVRTR